MAARALVVIGWLCFAVFVVSRVALDRALHTGVIPAAAAGTVYVHEDFVDGVGPAWQVPSTSHVGSTCVYPKAPDVDGGLLVLSVEKRASACEGTLRPYRGSALHTRDRFTPPFRVRASMKAAPGPGVVSAIFTYTDPFDGVPHVENDIELPAANFARRAVWLNQFAPWLPPENGDARYVDLDFDAAEDFHVFEIDVYVHETVWRVDGSIVRQEQNLSPPPPQSVRVNAWFKAVWPGVYFEPVSLSPKGRRLFVDFIVVDALDEGARP